MSSAAGWRRSTWSRLAPRLRSAPLATWLILSAVALAGVAHIALLPPWEGYDEFAHYSYVQQIADTGTIPLLNRDRISTTVDEYNGPFPYGNGDPPFDVTGKETYRGFRAHRAPKLTAGELQYRPATRPNWEAQHPPLFYALLAPLYTLTKHLDFTLHLFILRLAAWTIAFAGLAVGVTGTLRLVEGNARNTRPILAAFPFLVPEFFPEMARLGSDSLCLPLMSAVWLLCLRLTGDKARTADAVFLGTTLGLGLLTKAFFIPIAAGACAAIAVCGRGSRPRQLLLVGLLAFVFGGWWYVRNLLLLGSITGSADFTNATAAVVWNGLWSNVSILGLLEGLGRLVFTFAWAGTWSLARLPEALIAVPVLLVALTCGAWLAQLKSLPSNARLPLFLLGPFVLGLLTHMIVWLAMTRTTVTPGWYLHIAAVPIAFAMALGWKWPRLLNVLATLSVLVGIVAWILQLSLFSGCATKAADKYYSFTGADCFIDFSILNVLAFPGVAAVALALALLFAIAALVVLRRDRPLCAARA